MKMIIMMKRTMMKRRFVLILDGMILHLIETLIQSRRHAPLDYIDGIDTLAFVSHVIILCNVDKKLVYEK